MSQTIRHRIAQSTSRALSFPLAVTPSLWRPLDAIIIMGAPLRPNGGLSAVLQERVSVAAALWHRHPSMWIVPSGGITSYPQAAEATAMATALRDLGVSDARLLVESDARNTKENAVFSAALLLQRGAHSAWIVTQPFHLKRAVRHCKQAGIDAHGWLIIDGIEQARPLSAIKWTLREYAAWIKAYCR